MYDTESFTLKHQGTAFRREKEKKWSLKKTKSSFTCQYEWHAFRVKQLSKEKSH